MAGRFSVVSSSCDDGPERSAADDEPLAHGDGSRVIKAIEPLQGLEAYAIALGYGVEALAGLHGVDVVAQSTCGLGTFLFKIDDVACSGFYAFWHLVVATQPPTTHAAPLAQAAPGVSWQGDGIDGTVAFIELTRRGRR